jgi:hypothetical protein
MKEHIQTVAAPPRSIGFDAACAARLWQSIIVPMLLGGLKVSGPLRR